MLKRSKVLFDEEFHTYMLDGVFLSGITKVLGEKLFPDKYKDIPDAIVEKARERGSKIHKEIENSFKGVEQIFTSDEFDAFKKDTKDIKFIENEFIVSDEKKYASAIDLIDEDINLYDVKTSYKLDKEYVQWQLSIYAYLLEKQCDVKVGKLYGIHLKGDKCKITEVQRIDTDRVEALLYEDNVVKQDVDLVAYQDLCVKFRDAERQYKDLEKQFKDMKAKIADVMYEKGVYNFDNDIMSITLKDGYVKKQVDTDKMKKEYPDVYEECMKEVNVSKSITIKFK